MNVIPAINETDFEEIKKKILLAKSFGADHADGGASWVHLDVADGTLTPNETWNNPADLKLLNPKPSTLNPKLEIHLMVSDPDYIIKRWLDCGVKRIFIHYESSKDILGMKDECQKAGIELGLAIGPQIPVEGLFEYKNKIRSYLILAVNPGLAGQEFQPNQLDKIRLLREKMPDAKIEVDGGVGMKNAYEIRQAGADTLVSASYIWNNKNPNTAYRLLTDI